MNKTMKSGILLLLVMSLLLTMAACGRRDGGGGGGGGGTGAAGGEETGTLREEGLVYVPEFLSADLGGVMWPNLLAISGDTLYLRYSDPETNASGIGTLRTDGSGFTSIWEGSWTSEEEGDISRFSSNDVSLVALRPAGGLIMLRQSSDGHFNMETGESVFEEAMYLMAVSAAGTIEREVDLFALFGVQPEEGFWVSQLQSLSDCRVLLGAMETLYILNADFSIARQFPMWEDVQNIVVTADDRVLVTTSSWDFEENIWYSSTKPLNLETGEPEEGREIALPAWFHTLLPGVEYDLYIGTQQGVYGFDLGTGARTLLFTWMDIDMVNAAPFVVSDTGDIYFFETQWEMEGTAGPSSLVRLTKRDAAEIPEQIEITYGALFVSHEVRQQIVEFNRRNPQYRIRVIEYWDWTVEMNATAAIGRFHADLLAGNIPDILEFGAQTPFDLYARRGFLADLGALIDADPEINRGDLVESVMGLLEVDGTLYTVTPQFSIQTLVGRRDLVGPEMGWTMEEFLSIANALPEGGRVFDQWVTRESFLQHMLGANLGIFIDRETGITNFDSPLFMDYLAFAQTLATEAEVWPEDDGMLMPEARITPLPPIGEIGPGDEMENPYATGHILLMEQSLWGFAHLTHVREQFQGDVTFKGYPSERGIGSVADPRSVFGISANTAHMDAAWSFVRMFLTPAYQRQNAFAFATNRIVLEEQIDAAMNPPQMELPEAEADGDFFFPVDIPAATQAEIDQILELIDALDQLVMWEETVLGIITEETLPYFAGDRTVEETVRIIQSRVQMYISERR